MSGEEVSAIHPAEMEREREKIREAIEALSFSCSEKSADQFLLYREGVLSWNEKINLTAIRDGQEFLVKHFLDSLLCLDFEEYVCAKRVIDVGTGAGFPGVPLAIMSPEKTFVLMDSLAKRLKVIDTLTAQIDLANVQTIHARAEELARNKQHREAYDLCVSRAVANLAVLAEYCLPFIRPGGALLAYKGPEAESEAETAGKAISILGGRVERIQPVNLAAFGLDHRIVVIRKVKNTPAKYPRKAGTPAKEPLI